MANKKYRIVLTIIEFIFALVTFLGAMDVKLFVTPDEYIGISAILTLGVAIILVVVDFLDLSADKPNS